MVIGSSRIRGKLFRGVFALAASAMFAAAFASEAVARDVTKSVTLRSGAEGRVAFAEGHTDACVSLREPNIVGLSPPKHGKVFNRKIQELMKGADEPCAGRYLTGTEVRYQSNPGFVGNDEFVFDAVYPNGTFDRVRAVITVTAANPQTKVKAVTLRSGVEGKVYFAAHYTNSTCELASMPKFAGIRPPKNGKVFTAQAKQEIDDAKSPCKGRNVPGLEVRYQSKPDFAGTDEFLFDMLFADGDSVRIRAVITVTR